MADERSGFWEWLPDDEDVPEYRPITGLTATLPEDWSVDDPLGLLQPGSRAQARTPYESVLYPEPDPKRPPLEPDFGQRFGDFAGRVGEGLRSAYPVLDTWLDQAGAGLSAIGDIFKPVPPKEDWTEPVPQQVEQPYRPAAEAAPYRNLPQPEPVRPEQLQAQREGLRSAALDPFGRAAERERIMLAREGKMPTVMGPVEVPGLKGLHENVEVPLGAGVGDVLGSAGGAAEWLGQDWLATPLRVRAAEMHEDFPAQEYEFKGAESLADPAFYRDMILRSVPFLASLAPVAILGGHAGAAAAGAAGLGTIGTTIVSSITGGLASRVVESLMEAGQVYDDGLNQGMTEQQAADAARNTFLWNLPLSGPDAIEFALSFGKMPPGLKRAVSGMLGNRFGRIGVGMARAMGTAGMEAGEEIAQDVIQRTSLGQEVEWDPQMQGAAAVGAVLGGGMAGAGQAREVLQERPDVAKQLQEWATEAAPGLGIEAVGDEEPTTQPKQEAPIQPTAAPQGNADFVYKAGQAQADVRWGDEARDYERVRSGVAAVLREQGIDIDPMELNKRWHSPLASMKTDTPLDKVISAMEYELPEAKTRQYGEYNPLDYLFNRAYDSVVGRGQPDVDSQVTALIREAYPGLNSKSPKYQELVAQVTPAVEWQSQQTAAKRAEEQIAELQKTSVTSELEKLDEQAQGLAQRVADVLALKPDSQRAQQAQQEVQRLQARASQYRQRFEQRIAELQELANLSEPPVGTNRTREQELAQARTRPLREVISDKVIPIEFGTDQGWANGFMAEKGLPPKTSKGVPAPFTTTSKPNLSHIMPQDEGEVATIWGTASVDKNPLVAIVVMSTPDGSIKTAVSDVYYAYWLSRYPDAEFRIHGRGDAPLTVYSKGQIVGLQMPMMLGSKPEARAMLARKFPDLFGEDNVQTEAQRKQEDILREAKVAARDQKATSQPVKALDEWADRGKSVEVMAQDGQTRRGVIERTLTSSSGRPIYEINYGEGPRGPNVMRQASNEKVRFLSPEETGSDQDVRELAAKLAAMDLQAASDEEVAAAHKDVAKTTSEMVRRKNSLQYSEDDKALATQYGRVTQEKARRDSEREDAKRRQGEFEKDQKDLAAAIKRRPVRPTLKDVADAAKDHYMTKYGNGYRILKHPRAHTADYTLQWFDTQLWQWREERTSGGMRAIYDRFNRIQSEGGFDQASLDQDTTRFLEKLAQHPDLAAEWQAKTQKAEQNTAVAAGVPFKITEKSVQGGIELAFEEQPSAEVRESLKALHFRWSPKSRVWWLSPKDESQRAAVVAQVRQTFGVATKAEAVKEPEKERSALDRARAAAQAVQMPDFTPSKPVREMTEQEFKVLLEDGIRKAAEYAAAKSGTADYNAPANRIKDQEAFAAFKKAIGVPDLNYTDVWNPGRKLAQIKGESAPKPVAEERASVAPTPVTEPISVESVETETPVAAVSPADEAAAPVEVAEPVTEDSEAAAEPEPKQEPFAKRVYHATNGKPFAVFDPAMIGTATDEGKLGAAFYFSTDPNIGRVLPTGGRILNPPATIIEADVSLQNPLLLSLPRWEADKSQLVSDALGLGKRLSGSALTAELQARGYDGVVLDYSPVGYNHQEIAVFDAALITVIPSEQAAVTPESEAAAFVAEQQAEGKTPTVGEIREATGVDVPTAVKVRSEPTAATATDASVRDHPQSASVKNGIITITSKVGRQKAGSYTISVQEWDDATRRYGNPNAGQAEFIAEKTREMDDDEDGHALAVRIRDSQVYAIKKALQQIGHVTPAGMKGAKGIEDITKPVLPVEQPVPEPATAAPEQPQVSGVPEAPQEPPAVTTEAVIPAEVEPLPDVEPAQPTEAVVAATPTPENAELPSATPETETPVAAVSPADEAAAPVDSQGAQHEYDFSGAIKGSGEAIGRGFREADLRNAEKAMARLRAKYPTATDEQVANTPLGQQIARYRAELEEFNRLHPADVVAPVKAADDPAAQVDAFKADLIEQARAKIRDKLQHGEKVVIGDVRAWAKADAPTARQVLDEERAAFKAQQPPPVPKVSTLKLPRQPRPPVQPPVPVIPPTPPVQPPGPPTQPPNQPNPPRRGRTIPWPQATVDVLAAIRKRGFLRHLGQTTFQMRGLKQMASWIDPALVANGLVEEVALVFRRLDDQARNVTRTPAVRLEALWRASGAQINGNHFTQGAQIKDIYAGAQIKTESGYVPLSLAMSDVLEYPTLYNLTTGLEAFIDQAHQFADEFANEAGAEGVKLNQRKFEREILLADGTTRKVAGHYFGRMVREVREVTARGLHRSDMARSYESMESAIIRGVNYENDPVATAQATYDFVMRKVIGHRMNQLVKPLGRTIDELLPPGVKARYETANEWSATVRDYMKLVRYIRDGAGVDYKLPRPGQPAGTQPRDPLHKVEARVPGSLARLRAADAIADKDARLAEFRAILKDVTAMAGKARTARLAARDALAKAKERVGASEWAEGPQFGLPPGSIGVGKVAQSWAQGRLFPREIADYLNKQFKPDADRLVRGLHTYSGVTRSLKAGLDLGAPFINGLAVLTYDPKAWSTSFQMMLRSVADPEVYYSYMGRQDVQDILIKLIPEGLTIEGIEYIEAVVRGGVLENLAGRVPKIGGALQQQGIERIDMAFEAPLNVAKIEMAKALYPKYAAAGQLGDLATFLNNMTGTRSSQAMGLGGWQRSIESALLFFSPRYVRSSMALIADAVQGGMKGNSARRALAGMLVGGSLTLYAFHKLLGLFSEQPPDDEFLNPANSDFFRFNVFGGHVGLGGFWMSLLKTMGRSLMAARNNPNVFLDVLNRRDNPLAGWFSSRNAPAATLAWDIIDGRDYMGNELKTMDQWARYGGRAVTPMWLTDMVLPQPGDQPQNAALTAVSVFGLNANDLSPAEIRDRARDMTAQQMFGKRYDTLTALGRMKLKGNAQLQAVEEEVLGIQAARGNVGAEYRLQVAKQREPLIAQIKANEEALDRNEIDYSTYRWRVGNIEAEIAQIPQHLHEDPKYKDVPVTTAQWNAYMRKYGIEDTPPDAADQFRDVWYALTPKFIDKATGAVDSIGLDLTRNALIQKYPPEVVEEGMAAIRIHRAQTRIKGVPLTMEEANEYERLQLSERAKAVTTLRANAQFQKLNSQQQATILDRAIGQVDKATQLKYLAKLGPQTNRQRLEELRATGTR